MDQTTFETELREQGYAEVVHRRTDANAVNHEHAVNSMPRSSSSKA